MSQLPRSNLNIVDIPEDRFGLLNNGEEDAVKQKIKLRRRAIYFSIITIFSVTAFILVLSVLHEEMNKQNVGYEDLVCQKSDLECFKLICPQGWKWSIEKDECSITEGKKSDIF